MQNRQRTQLRAALYAGAALAGLIASPAFAQSETVAKGSAAADKATAIVLAQADPTPAAPTTGSGSTTVKEVVVTGIRASEISAIKAKRLNEDIVDVITAEDIGKLPDDSIADSIARLPGLAAQRDNSGRTQDISIDGLPSAMNITLLNGFMQATTDNNRTTQFDQYPAEIMSSVVVYKTGDASLVGQAIGTIDMQTVKPLDYGKTNLFVGVNGEYDLQGKLQPGASDTGYRANVTYITQLFDDKLGVMAAYAHIDTPNQITAVHPYGYYVADDQLQGGIQDQLRSDTLTRDSGTITLQYKPVNGLEFIVHGFDSTYNDNAIIRGVEFQPNGCPASISNGVSTWAAGPAAALCPNPPYNNAQLQPTQAVAPQLESYDYQEKSRLRSVDFTMNYKFGDGWKAHVDYGYNDASNTFDELQLYSGFGLNGQQNTSTATLTQGTGPGGTIGISNWSENLQHVALGENLGWSNYIPAGFPGACVGGVVSPNNPPQWGSTCNGGPDPDQLGGAGQNLIQTTIDSIQQTKWSISRELAGPITNIEVGAAYSIRKKSYSVIEDELYLLSGNESQAIPANLLSSPTNLSVFGLPSMFSINPQAALNSGLYGSVADERAPGGGNGASLSDWAISEKVFTPYFKATLKTELGGRPLVGNFGVQAVDTSQRVVDSYETNPGGTVFNHITVPTTTDYWEVLPSLNLTWRLDDNQDLRFAVDRSLARARFDELGGGSSVSYNFSSTCNTSGCPSPWSGSVANPALKPWIADDVQFTYEHYFAPGEGVSVEGFYKYLESYISPETGLANFQGYYNASGPYPGAVPFTFVGPVSEYVNGSGGSLYGLVLSGNFQLKHLATWLDGFGFSGTASVIESTVRIPTAAGCSPIGNVGVYQTPCQSGTPNGQLPQYSKYVGNVSFYYEKNGWSLRINDRYRSRYDQEVVDYNGGLQPILGDAENIVDLQAGYDIKAGPLKNLSFTFQAQNLTNTPMNSYNGAYNSATGAVTPQTPKDTIYYKLFGTNILFGVRYKY
jgi:iron complex outermembrane receptor protein